MSEFDMPRKKVADTANAKPDFESALADLEQLVQRMESGELSLEDSLSEFERGIRLTRVCQDALKVAEQRVKLVNSDGQTSDFTQLGDA